MNGPLDELFLEWLYSRVADAQETDPSKTHWLLFKQMYTKEFVWIVPNDDNRIMDGKDLRREFIHSRNVRHAPLEWMDIGCSVLEMLIALSRRISFEDLDEGEPCDWFWHLLRNLKIDGFTDETYLEDSANVNFTVEDQLNQLIFRTYHPSGRGGLFPQKHPCDDQREVDIWYQMGLYLDENSVRDTRD